MVIKAAEHSCVLECCLLYIEAAPALMLEVTALQSTACMWGFNPKHGHGHVGAYLLSIDLGNRATGMFLTVLQKSINNVDL